MSDLIFTQPIETMERDYTASSDGPTNGTALPATQTADGDCDPLNLWLKRNLLWERERVLDTLAEAFAIRSDELLDRIEPLEKRLAALAELDRVRAARDKGLVELERELKEAFDRKTREVSEVLNCKVRELIDTFHGLEVRVAEIAGVSNALRHGRALNFRDGFDPAERYQLNDVVMVDGSSFVAIEDRPGTCPGQGWRLLASAGKRGERGRQGLRGMSGLRGEPGTPAPKPVGWHINTENYTATLVFNDGTIAPELNLRKLFDKFYSDLHGS